ncbi:unnamed protein product [Schistosoma curassoni]|uniref:EF-hand domain-containing protein n=1 Tax=Schistosoma curassoni TaxID=6186 RepID=A0A183JI64_9TREM|nr:unnamed protein product [Schistosoma curassoni]VDO74214.1 unnamed protein product [Schistosoma curassoni]
MACTKTKRRARTRTQRFTSNVFSMFNEAQISEFKEAFLMIDSTKDGVIDKHDLEDIFISLGKSPNDEYLNDMLSQAPGQINFTMFLTLFGEKMMGCDPEETILNAFACFDPEGTGMCNELMCIPLFHVFCHYIRKLSLHFSGIFLINLYIVLFNE